MFLLVLGLGLSASHPASADWTAVEKVSTYAVSGTTGPELYASIGERGPKASVGRAIAHTDFKLTWTRDYQPRDGACILVSARPKLVITYTLPKAPVKLPEATRRLWTTFIEGVEAHEKVHGRQIEDMVRAIEVATVGLSVAGDPTCRKIRETMVPILSGLSQEQRRLSREFDRVELAEGGAVHQLILNLVNGR